MTKVNDFNITEEELKEIEEIKELAQGCSDYLLDSLVNPVTNEKVEVSKEEKNSIFKLVLDRTMVYIDENDFPNNEEEFANYVECIFEFVAGKLS